MIGTALVLIISGFLVSLGFILPETDLLPSNFYQLIEDLFEYVYAWNWLVPVGTMVSVVGAGITFLLAEFAFKGGKYVIALLRGN